MKPLHFVAIMIGGLVVAGTVTYLLAPPPPTYVDMDARLSDPKALPITLAEAGRRPPAADTAYIDDGKPMRLSQHSGQVVMVHYWATWCAPCIAEMPGVDALAQRLSGQGLTLVPLSLDKDGDAVVRRFYQQIGLNALAVAFPAKGEEPPDSVPFTRLIDKQGRVAWESAGARPWDGPEVEGKIRALLAE